MKDQLIFKESEVVSPQYLPKKRISNICENWI